MSCNKPMHMLHFDFAKFFFNMHATTMQILDYVERYEKLGWKINPDDMQGYRLIASDTTYADIEKALDSYNIPGNAFELIEVPCGHCIGCRLDYAKDWANRCYLEAKQYQHNYFITLTYDDDHMPIGKIGNGTLKKDDFGLFIKNVRNWFQYHSANKLAIKYFGCGEYGDMTFRPHYHLILFNCPIPDLTINFPSDIPGSYIQKKDQRGGNMFYSPMLAKCWDKGIITIQPATWNMECYVSKYVLKKLNGKDADSYKSLGVEPPFLRASQGLGRKHLVDNLESIKDDPTIIVGRQGKSPLVSGLPRYFKKYLKQKDPEYYKGMKDKAKVRTNDTNSRIRAYQKLNDNRRAKESQLNANNQFSRDF